ESSNHPTQIGKLFHKVGDMKFIPDNMIPGVGHIKNMITRSIVECSLQCVKTKKCAQINVEKVTERTWNCDLFGWGTGSKVSSPGHQHYTMMFSECKGGFLTNIYNGSAYCFHQGPLNWTDAEIKCLEYGAHLVTIETESEEIALETHAFTYGQNNLFFHIGLNDRAVANDYIWTGSRKSATYYAWGTDEPNPDDDSHCIALSSYRNYKWADIPCSTYKVGFICEQ
ncbi:unnamed protein product, partial [Owenia fusiformis]